MDTQFDFQLELNTRQAREMCSVMNNAELTELVVSMYRSDFLKNQWMKTFFLGDANGFSKPTSDILTDEELAVLISWQL